MKYHVRKAVVVGAGTMGAALAALLANAGVPVMLLDIVPKGAPKDDKAASNRLADEGLERAKKSRPSAFVSSDRYALVSTGNLEDDFERAIGEADWVIEAIVEELKIKRSLMARIDQVRKPETIISTNTSGIPVGEISDGRSESFRQHFLGTHFFNPPRYLKLMEVIPTEDTLPEVVDFIEWFGELHLGKGVVICKDRPNFIANRLAYGTGSFALDYVMKNGYTVEEVDAVTGRLMGRPKTGTFRLLDLVGIDVWEHVGRNLIEAIPDDKYAMPYLLAEKPNALVRTMVENGWLGDKTKIGFYKMIRGEDGKKEFWPLDLEKLEHVPPSKPRFDSVGKAKDMDDLGERMRFMLGEDDRAAELVRMLTYQAFQYASSLLPEVADTVKPVDDAMRWGFGHQAGPFEMWDMLGVAETVEQMKTAGFDPAPWVADMLKSGQETFYQYEGDHKTAVYDVSQGKLVPTERPKSAPVIKESHQGKQLVIENAGASLYDIGDGVAQVEFHTKMNTLDEDIMNLTNEALDRVETDFDGLVIGSEADNFSAGANLFLVVMASQQGMWDMLDQVIRKLQDLNQRIRYFPKPVVVAPAGLSLGGGCEVPMHASRIVAAAETYIGLVEVGAGVIPAGGGTKEIIRRLINPPMRTKNAMALPFLEQAFMQIGQAKVSTSAEEARQMGIFGPADRIVLNRDMLLAEAKREVLHLSASGYVPPVPEQIYAAGRDMLAALRVGAFMFKAGGQISEHDQLVAEKLAYVLTGGELSRPQWVSEQYILDLEREAFLSLCGEEKTQQRMWALLQTGKPLRN
jgi:3-hydroxyacyl-CoA dehydrogenase